MLHLIFELSSSAALLFLSKPNTYLMLKKSMVTAQVFCLIEQIGRAGVLPELNHGRVVAQVHCQTCLSNPSLIRDHRTFHTLSLPVPNRFIIFTVTIAIMVVHDCAKYNHVQVEASK